MQQVHALPMQNKKYHVVLLAGGPRDRAREIRDYLAKRRDIYIKYHREWDKERQWDRPIPDDVDFVIMLKTMMGHPNFFKLKDACKKRGIRFIITQHSNSTIVQALYNHGIKATNGIPIEVASTAHFDHDLELPKPKVLHVVPEVREEDMSGIPLMAPVVEPKPVPPPPAPNINILVAQTPIPENIVATCRPRAETMVLISALFKMVQEDNISVMLTPTNFTVETMK